MSRAFSLIVLLLVLVLGASIGYFNAQAVEFNYLIGSRQLPLIGVLMLAFALGVALSLLAVLARLLAARVELRRLRRQLREAEGELRTLRNLPVTANPEKP
ncbi:Uncharacterized integral membrane protein [Solimonas aquatica]|uniref:Uncharacterized integral membrane protein n=1 Tax=Solimonas aquatica TaxID=489703 RepID=A0A1H8ZX00_9GAMM|nr:LapA family protein [Solimonas aquatica]SEP68855.1 Uncharacterized integral membrane protein [Solimonas aquatica]